MPDPLAQYQIDDIERVDPPSPNEFIRRYLRPSRPVVIRSPDSEKWTLARLALTRGGRKVSALRTGAGRLRNSAQKGVGFEQVQLVEILTALAEGRDPGWHVSVPLDDLPADFVAHLPTPPYCANAPLLRSRLWLAVSGTVTPLHSDMPRNFLQLAFGRRRLLMYPPIQGLLVSPNSPTSKAPNFARFNPEHPDLRVFPLARFARPQRTVLSAGEALYIPPGWWHHARSLDTSLAINYWWGGRMLELAWNVSQSYNHVRELNRGGWS